MSGSTTTVVVNDASSCTPAITRTLSFSCGANVCTTDAGTLAAGPYLVCQGELLQIPAVTGSVLDSNDALVYVLDDDLDPANGVLAEAASPQFTEPSGANNRLLYVYTLAGNSDASGNVDLTDQCTVTSAAVRVRWVTPLLATSTVITCEADGSGYRVTVELTGGERPYLSSGTTSGSFSADGSTFTSVVVASGQTAAIELSSSAGGCAALVLTPTRVCSVTCTPPDPGTFASALQTLCGGGSSDGGYNNDAQIAAGEQQQFIVYADANRSTVLLRTQTLPIDFSQFGTDVLVYLSSYAGTTGSNGMIDPACAAESALQPIRIVPQVQLRFDTVVCPPVSFVRFGVVFDQANPRATIVLPGQNGACDTTLLAEATFTNGGNRVIRTDTLCADERITIGGREFTAANPSATFTTGSGACQDEYVVDLVFRPAATSSIQRTLCVGEELVVGNRTFDVNTPRGTATLTARSGCDSVVTVDLTFETAPTVAIIGPAQLCDPTEVVITVTVGGGRAVAGSVRINGGAPQRIDLSTGSNTLRYPAASGPFRIQFDSLRAVTGSCTTAVPSRLSYSPQISRLQARIDEPLAGGYRSCSGSTVESIGVIPAAGIGPYRYLWSTGDTTQSIRDVGVGTYSVDVTDAVGCMSSSSVTVSEADSLLYTLATVDPSCAGGLGTVSISLDDLPPGLLYRFDGPGLQPLTTPDLTIDSLRAGRYVFQLVQDNGCDQVSFITITDPERINFIKPDSIQVRLGDSVRLRIDTVLGDRIRWAPAQILSCDTCAVTMAGPVADTEVTVQVTDAQGCITSDLVQLVILPAVEVFIPSAFSPNEDGVNDLLLPLTGPEVARVLGFQVYDRWGEPVHQRFNFAPNDARAGWNGTFRGRDMDPAVFVVVAEVQLVNGEVRTVTGDVTLLR